MLIKNVTYSDLIRALAKTNQKFDGNIIFNNCTGVKINIFRVTLRVKNSHGKGARISYNGRHLINACWHVHGYFFEQLLKETPNAIIKTVVGKIDKFGGNWIDQNVGSQLRPIMLSELCECVEPNPHPEWRFEDTFLTEPIEIDENTKIKQKVWEDYDLLDQLARKFGYETPEPDNNPDYCGWIATLGDKYHDPIKMLKEAMDKLRKAKTKHKDAIMGFCQTGHFSVGYTIYVKG